MHPAFGSDEQWCHHTCSGLTTTWERTQENVDEREEGHVFLQSEHIIWFDEIWSSYTTTQLFLGHSLSLNPQSPPPSIPSSLPPFPFNLSLNPHSLLLPIPHTTDELLPSQLLSREALPGEHLLHHQLADAWGEEQKRREEEGGRT